MVRIFAIHTGGRALIPGWVIQ